MTNVAAAQAEADAIAAKAQRGEQLTPAEVERLPQLERILRTASHPRGKSTPAKATDALTSSALDPERFPVGEAARLFGYDRRTLQNDLKAEPSLRAAEGFIRVPAWLQWKLTRVEEAAYEETAPNKRNWKKLREKYQALREQLKLLGDREEVIAFADAEAEQVRMATEVRTRLQALPQQLSLRVSQDQRTHVRELWDEEIRDILTVLSECSVRDSASDSGQAGSPRSGRRRAAASPNGPKKKSRSRRSTAHPGPVHSDSAARRLPAKS